VDYGAGIENDSFWLSTGGFSFLKLLMAEFMKLKAVQTLI
jgi:hypothetical protein